MWRFHEKSPHAGCASDQRHFRCSAGVGLTTCLLPYMRHVFRDVLACTTPRICHPQHECTCFLCQGKAVFLRHRVQKHWVTLFQSLVLVHAQQQVGLGSGCVHGRWQRSQRGFTRMYPNILRLSMFMRLREGQWTLLVSSCLRSTNRVNLRAREHADSQNIWIHPRRSLFFKYHDTSHWFE